MISSCAWKVERESKSWWSPSVTVMFCHHNPLWDGEDKYYHSDITERIARLKEKTVNCWSVAKSCPTLCDPMDCNTPGFPVLHHLLEFAQTHVHQVSDAIQPPHPLLPHSFPALNLSQHQGFFPWVSSSYQVAKVLEFQLQSSVLPTNIQD